MEIFFLDLYIFFLALVKFFWTLVLSGLLIFFHFFFLLPQCKIIRPLWYIGRLILAEEFNCMYRPQTYMSDCILKTLFAGTIYSNTHCKLKIFYILEYLKLFFAPPFSFSAFKCTPQCKYQIVHLYNLSNAKISVNIILYAIPLI